MKNSEEREFKGLTFDEHQVAMRKGPQSLTGLRPTCLSKVSFEYLNGRLEFREIPFECKRPVKTVFKS